MKFLVFFLSVYLVCAAFDEETNQAGKAAVKLLANKCQKDEGASVDDMDNLAEGSLPKTREGKCLLACFSKQISLIEEDGSLSQDMFKIISESVLENENDELKTAVKEIGTNCKGPFDEEDSCENSYLMYKCFEDEKDKIKSLYQ